MILSNLVFIVSFILSNLAFIVSFIYIIITVKVSFIYAKLFEKNVHEQSYPEPAEFESEITSEDLIAFNSAIWKAKKDGGVSMKDPVKKATAPESLKSAEVELKAMHNIQSIEFGKEIKVEL